MNEAPSERDERVAAERAYAERIKAMHDGDPGFERLEPAARTVLRHLWERQEMEEQR